MPMIKAIELDLAVAMTAPGDKEGMPLRRTRFVWATADTGCRWPFRALSRRCSARLRLSKDPAKVRRRSGADSFDALPVGSSTGGGGSVIA
jgi:hypothetical protein